LIPGDPPAGLVTEARDPGIDQVVADIVRGIIALGGVADQQIDARAFKKPDEFTGYIDEESFVPCEQTVIEVTVRVASENGAGLRARRL
jgi:hypothetical protein